MNRLGEFFGRFNPLARTQPQSPAEAAPAPQPEEKYPVAFEAATGKKRETLDDFCSALLHRADFTEHNFGMFAQNMTDLIGGERRDAKTQVSRMSNPTTKTDIMIISGNNPYVSLSHGGQRAELTYLLGAFYLTQSDSSDRNTSPAHKISHQEAQQFCSNVYEKSLDFQPPVQQ